MNTTIESSLAEHFPVVAQRYDEALQLAGFDAVIIGAGPERYRFRDDLTYPFAVNAYLKQWIPLPAHPGSGLIYRPGARPRLIVPRREDYWHHSPPLPGEPWTEHLNIVTVADAAAANAIWQQQKGRIALLGETEQWPRDAKHVNPDALLRCLDYYRPYKTAYERECIGQANRLAATAHLAVADAFRAGASEYELLLTFLSASAHTQDELPYPAIIAMNRNCATLHYQNYRRTSGELHSLLIDAGCQFNGYAADVSRSYAYADSDYASMIEDLDREQQAICARAGPGVSFVDLNRQAHEAIARLLDGWGLVSGEPAALVDTGITRAFMPHGLGHYVGQQVHEPGGLLANPAGKEIDRPAEFPHLRLARTLETDQVLTIEPGIYFIDSLLGDLRRSDESNRVNWPRIDSLRKFGGMRIEDNLAITTGGTENLTRQAFAGL